MESPGDEEEEETVTEEEATPVQEESAEREDVAISVSDEDDTSEETSEDEGIGVANIELETGPVGPLVGFGEVAGGGGVAGPPQEVPLVGPGVQETIPPIAPPQEPVSVAEPVVAEPLVTEPLLFEEPIYFGEPIYFEEPTLLVEEPREGGAAVDTSIAATAQTGNAFANS